MGVDERFQDFEDVVWLSVGGEVEIRRFATQECIAHRAAHQRKLVPGVSKAFAEFDKQRLTRDELEIGERLGNRLHGF